jgi:hypothetical protein
MTDLTPPPRFATVRGLQDLARERAIARAAAQAAEAGPCSGWFESSFELRAGLVVSEAPPSDEPPAPRR